MRKTPQTEVQRKPPERFPLNIRQSLFVVSAILKRISARELAMSESHANVSAVPKLTEVRNEN